MADPEIVNDTELISNDVVRTDKDKRKVEEVSADFAQRKQRAVRLLLNQIGQLNGRANDRRVEVTDTGAAGRAHVEAIDRNRRYNAGVDKDLDYQTRLLHDLISELDKLMSASEVWSWMNKELSSLLLANNEDFRSCFKSKESGGGINWFRVSEVFRNSPVLERSRAGLQGQMQGLQNVYSCFWL